MDLAAQTRTVFGKKVRTLRQQGFIPAELYGHGTDNMHLTVLQKDFKRVFKQAGENMIVNLTIFPFEKGEREGVKVPVLIYNVSHHPVTDAVATVDFYQVRLDEKIRAKVPVEFTGESPAVKEKGGILVKAMQEIEVEALPADIPHSFVVALAQLTELNQSLYVRDLAQSKKVKVLVELHSVVATIKAQMTEEEEKALEAAAVPSVETIKVETEEKKALRQAQTDAAAAPTSEVTK